MPSITNTAQWTVPPDHPAFAGHFPGAPILPGVVLLDIALHVISDAHGVALHACKIGSVKFLSPARPGDALEIQHRGTTSDTSDTIHFDIVAASRNPRKIATGSVSITAKSAGVTP